MSQLTPEIPFMASLWIRSGYDMKVGKSAETYQVGAHFKALIKAILVAPSRTLEKFFFNFMSPCRAVVPFESCALYLQMKDGMVLVMSLWDDHAVNMLWLDSDYPPDQDASTPGVNREFTYSSSNM